MRLRNTSPVASNWRFRLRSTQLLTAAPVTHSVASRRATISAEYGRKIFVRSRRRDHHFIHTPAARPAARGAR